jgi:hypothetical protein
MPAPTSERVTESGRSDSASPPHGCMQGGPSLASLGSQEFHSRIQDWSNDESSPGPGFVAQAYSYPEDPASIPRSPPSIQSSMALTAQSVSSLDSAFTQSIPSLSSGSSSASDSSLRSSAASDAVRPGLFDDEESYVSSTRSDIQADNASNPVEQQPKGVACLFGFLDCRETFTNVDWWNQHCKSHFKGKAPPRQLRCPYSSCTWITSGQNGEDAWDQRWEHIDLEHDVLSNGGALREEPSVQLFQHLWNARIITEAELQELRKCGRLGSDRTSFVVAERRDRHERPRKASRR